jgi:SPP1 gp7 family putative phage head morphogenesis protein
MHKSEVVRLVQIQKQKLLEREGVQMKLMARRWLSIEKELEAEMLKTAAAMSEETLVTEAMILRNTHFQTLMYQARAEFGKYADYLGENLNNLQKQNLVFGINNAFMVLQAGLYEAGLGVTFNKLNVNALDAMIGFSADGSPLSNLLMKSYGEAVNGILSELLNGLAKGNNPVKIAQAMADGFGIGLERAMTISRTEIMRSYRTGSLEQYKASGVVTQYKRMATKDDTTCLGCLFSDGQIFDTAEEFSEHPNGRCQIIPVVRGATEPTWETGSTWFEKQNAETQVSILGQARFDAWKSGASLSDMSNHVENTVWGGKFVPTPISKL